MLFFGRILEQTIFADIVAAGEEDDGLALGRNHQLETNAADVRLNLVGHLLVHLLGLLVVALFEGTVDLPDQVNRVVLNALLHVQLLLDLLPLPLLVPNLPFLLVLPHLLVLAHL